MGPPTFEWVLTTAWKHLTCTGHDSFIDTLLLTDPTFHCMSSWSARDTFATMCETLTNMTRFQLLQNVWTTSQNRNGSYNSMLVWIEFRHWEMHQMFILRSQCCTNANGVTILWSMYMLSRIKWRLSVASHIFGVTICYVTDDADVTKMHQNLGGLHPFVLLYEISRFFRWVVFLTHILVYTFETRVDNLCR